MSDQKPRGVYSNEVRRTTERYEGWVNGKILFSNEINLERSLEVKDLIDRGWRYRDIRPQHVNELKVNEEAA